MHTLPPNPDWVYYLAGLGPIALMLCIAGLLKAVEKRGKRHDNENG